MAAERLGRSQPAVSQSVARLRDILGDRLFERTATGVDPTPPAEAIWHEIRDPLLSITQSFTHESFVPASIRSETTIGLADDIHEIAFARLALHLRERAPRLVLRVLEIDHQSVWSDVKSGRVDLAMTVAPPAPRGLGGKTMFEQRFVLLHRPDASPPTTLAAYLKATHVGTSFSSGEPGYIDQRLVNMGQARDVIARVPHFGSVRYLVARTSALATLPEPIARHYAQ